MGKKMWISKKGSTLIYIQVIHSKYRGIIFETQCFIICLSLAIFNNTDRISNLPDPSGVRNDLQSVIYRGISCYNATAIHRFRCLHYPPFLHIIR